MPDRSSTNQASSQSRCAFHPANLLDPEENPREAAVSVAVGVPTTTLVWTCNPKLDSS